MDRDHAAPSAADLPRRLLAGLCIAALGAAPLHAQVSAAQPVEQLHAALLDVSRQAQALGVQGRFNRLRSVMEASFDLPAMTRIAIGPAWTRITPEQQAALVQAFSEWSIATYANRFNGFSGESFTTEGESELRNGDRLIRTVLNRPGNSAVQLNYLVRRSGGTWRIVDVYLTGSISELASRRADFAALLAEGGPARLAAELRRRSAALLQG
ncbi:ABC transporter substrate-binding protein (plasmid) [Roseomonas marmotae]|nr:ABC transporter substrate-binding protein [Roseomonas marmotae]QTI81388.1 ABC transporter substrate-binding protein [Roseomonas marmotae]